MRNISLYTCLAFIFFAFSCTNNNTPEIDTSLIQFNQTDSLLLPAESLVTQSKMAPAAINSQAIPVAPTEAYTQAGLNPPHGQPGHDCSIAVGAPLKGNSMQVAPSSPAPPSPVLTSPPSGNTGKLNPPHGQPGHDCAIPVGQPLG
jgi:hypothetical protein